MHGVWYPFSAVFDGVLCLVFAVVAFALLLGQALLPLGWDGMGWDGDFRIATMLYSSSREEGVRSGVRKEDMRGEARSPSETAFGGSVLVYRGEVEGGEEGRGGRRHAWEKHQSHDLRAGSCFFSPL